MCVNQKLSLRAWTRLHDIIEEQRIREEPELQSEDLQVLLKKYLSPFQDICVPVVYPWIDKSFLAKRLAGGYEMG